MNNTLLDIIVVHHDEPWKICQPFFDMIDNQRCVDFNSFTVTVVHSGENNLDWHELLSHYRFKVKVISIDEAPLATARNEGMKNTSSDWLMFCDIDDMFADVCSLRMMIDQFPVHDYDLIWMKYVMEEKWQGKTVFINRVEEPDLSGLTGKMYRRKFLEENNITFDSRIPMYSDYMFNATIIAHVQPFRVVMLTTNFYVYYKTFREDSLTHKPENTAEFIRTRFDRDYLLAHSFKERGLDYEYRKALTMLICCEYYRVYDPEKDPNPAIASDKFLAFYAKHKDVLNRMTTAEIDVVKDMAETETMCMIQNFYNDHTLEYYFANDTISFSEWLEKIDKMTVVNDNPMPVASAPASTPAKDTTPVVIDSTPKLINGTDYMTEEEYNAKPAREPRVAVYCGTYNTYMNMATSAKSLLWHTKMDKVYFLIEDDVFPYDLPDIVECINVKDQKFFPHDGPNYDNSWSYMCMMRAAFTKLIPYDKILSLDIDVVIQEDIGCLWDIDMTDYYLAGVTEPQRQKSTNDPIYINFGVVMMNLKKLREDGLDDQIIESLNTTKHGCPEQDAFNKFCAWHIYQLPNDYNATVHSHITGEAEHERIIHYAGIKFWRHFGQVKEYGNRQWDIVMDRQAKLK